jgi:hypothetical protein
MTAIRNMIVSDRIVIPALRLPWQALRINFSGAEGRDLTLSFWRAGEIPAFGGMTG